MAFFYKLVAFLEIKLMDSSRHLETLLIFRSRKLTSSLRNILDEIRHFTFVFLSSMDLICTFKVFESSAQKYLNLPKSFGFS